MTVDTAYEYFPQDSGTPASERDTILVIYTGGTIGAVPSDRADRRSPLEIASWDEFNREVRELEMLRSGPERIRIDAVALTVPLDSSNVEPAHWGLFVDIIRAHYESVMGFVILHGTDTMVFTASALSFMLNGLDKPVVITGSQIPILHHPHTDGVRNLVNAIRVAAWKVTGVPKVGEVSIAFGERLLRGNRARKRAADDLDGFDSPNFPPLGTFGEHITVNTELLWRSKTARFAPRGTHNPDVISFQIFPGIQNSSLLKQVLASPDLKGAVLQAYGAGNGPTSDAFLDPLKTAVDDGKIIIDVTQCFSGSVRLGQYETGVGLVARGVLSGSDLTPEAALCKLMVLLGRTEMEGAVGKFVQRSLAGEQSESSYASVFSALEGERFALDGQDARVDLSRSVHDTSWDRSNRVASAWLHLHDTRIAGPGPVTFEIYFQVDPDQRVSEDQHGYAATVVKTPYEGASWVSIEVTAGVSALEPGLPPRVTIVVRSEGVVSFASASLVVSIDARTQ